MDDTPLELILDEARICGARYYTAKPIIDWWVLDRPEYNPWRNMTKWCKDTYGPTPNDGVWTPGARWYMNDSRFWFRDQKDLEWFILRWE